MPPQRLRLFHQKPLREVTHETLDRMVDGTDRGRLATGRLRGAGGSRSARGRARTEDRGRTGTRGGGAEPVGVVGLSRARLAASRVSLGPLAHRLAAPGRYSAV